MTNRMEWQPIETAPKDGRRFIAFAYGPHGVDDVYFSVAQWAMDGPGRIQPHVEGWFWEFAIRPTHWMPLPEPPLVDHPRPTTPIVDHEGGESEPLRAFADAAYESTGGPTQALKDVCAAYRDNEERAVIRAGVEGVVALWAGDNYSKREIRLATRIAELEAEVAKWKAGVELEAKISTGLEAEVERLKGEVEAEREACAELAKEQYDYCRSRKKQAGESSADNFWGGCADTASIIHRHILSRSTAMNKGGE